MAQIRNIAQIATGNERFNCFVCDAVVVGSYYTLASCRTQKSKVRLIEKLGQLVGDQYMVVISEDDVICRTCTSMMNNLDRLEREMFTVRSVVLRFLEKKYALEEGELVNSKISLPAQKFPPNISNLKKTKGSELCVKKRKATDMEADEVELVNGTENNNGSKPNTWLQCDKCKYKTPYNSFMVNHIQRHSPKNSLAASDEKEKLNDVLNEPPPVSKPPVPNPDPVTPETEASKEPEVKSKHINVVVPVTEEPAESETVEMIAAEINDLNDKEKVSDINDKVIMNLVQTVDPKQEFMDDQHSLTLEVEGEEGVLDTANAICMVDENGMILQKMEQAEDGTYYMHVMEGDSAKQVLSVNEDGTIQMVEVLWDGIGAQAVNVDDNIPF